MKYDVTEYELTSRKLYREGTEVALYVAPRGVQDLLIFVYSEEEGLTLDPYMKPNTTGDIAAFVAALKDLGKRLLADNVFPPYGCRVMGQVLPTEPNKTSCDCGALKARTSHARWCSVLVDDLRA